MADLQDFEGCPWGRRKCEIFTYSKLKFLLTLMSGETLTGACMAADISINFLRGTPLVKNTKLVRKGDFFAISCLWFGEGGEGAEKKISRPNHQLT